MVRENWYGDARWRKVEWRTTLASSKSAMGACHEVSGKQAWERMAAGFNINDLKRQIISSIVIQLVR
jgi:hypothetical protein